jgi:hypothetical protein
MGEEVRWRAWLGVGDDSHLSQIDVAEFGTSAAARAWVERRLAAIQTRPGLAVFGSVDRGVHREVGGWTADPYWVGMDAHLVDGRVCWRRPGCR